MAPLGEVEQRVFERELETYLDKCEVVELAVISTLDGRLQAQKQRATFETELTAVMGSSLMALGDTILNGLHLGTCETVIAESQQGLALFNHIAGSFVLISVTRSKNGLGSLLSWAKRIAEDIAQSLPKSLSSSETQIRQGG